MQNVAGGGMDNMEDIDKKLKENGLLLKGIRKKDQTIEQCKIAIQENPRALRHASAKCVDQEICLNAVKEDASMFQYVPPRLITEEMCKLAVSVDAYLLVKVPEDLQTNEVCLLAIKNNVNAFSYVIPEKRYELLSEEIPLDLIKGIVNCNNKWLQYLPVCKETDKLCLEYIEQDFSLSRFLPETMKLNRDILEYQKSTGKVLFISKSYDVNRGVFLVEAEIICDTLIERENRFINKFNETSYNVVLEFQSFSEFYSFLGGNLTDAELRSYDFEGIDLRKYNIEGAIIHNDVLGQQELYNGSFYADIKKNIEETENLDFVKDEICVHTDFRYPKPIDDNGYDKNDMDHIPFFYVSDIHLCHRIRNHFGERATREEIYSYVKSLARKMITSIGTVPFNSCLLIAGDTSSDFEIAKIFYRELTNYWKGKIVIVSGNHELRDPYIDIADNIQEYRNYFNEIGIIYLHNELLVIDDSKLRTIFMEDEFLIAENSRSCIIIKEEELLAFEEDEIRQLTICSSVIILGGIGFSGLNDKYNAVSMRYGKSFDTVTPEMAMQRDIKESKKFDDIYTKLLSSIPKSKLIVLTHMKKDDWSTAPYNPYWIYLSGHSHRNFREVNEDKVIYADNQIGYRSNNIGLKYFYIDKEYDIFSYYEDGIHEITREQYIEFNIGKNIQMSFKRVEGTIYMLKKKDTYLFFIYCSYSKQMRGKSLYIMNGGQLRKLKRNRIDDLIYYYGSLEKYIENVQQLLSKYTRGQEKLSEFIKKLGGSGKIHGCIVDVERPSSSKDFSYCHLFVNPTDGKVTPYFAYDVKSRYVYKDFKTMLEAVESCVLLKENYLIFESESSSNLPDIQYSKQMEAWGKENAIYDEGSYLYKISRIIKSLQYISEKNVIRIWNEELLNYDFVKRVCQASALEDMVVDTLLVENE